MSQVVDDIVVKCYERVKSENPRMPEGDVLARVAQILDLTTDRVGEALRQPVPIRRYAVICRHKNSDFGGFDKSANL